MEDTYKLGNHTFTSRFILGSGKFSLDVVNAAVEEAGAQIITLALRRANIGGIANILDYVPKGVTILPNTSGARNADEALRIARLARECGCGDFVKVEVIHESKYLLPDNYQTAKATELMAKEGFIVLPYMYPDLNAARDMVNAGAAAIMPLGAPIGTNKGLVTKEFAYYCGCRHWQTFTSLRSHGNGRHSDYGKYCHCHSRQCSSHGACLQTRH